MIELATLMVLVTFVGGPRTAELERPHNAPGRGSVIEIVEPVVGIEGTVPEVVAMSRLGDVTAEVTPGTYTVTARVGPGAHPCGGGPRVVTIPRLPVSGSRRHVRGTRLRVVVRPHPVRLHFFCGIR